MNMKSGQFTRSCQLLYKIMSVTLPIYPIYLTESDKCDLSRENVH